MANFDAVHSTAQTAEDHAAGVVLSTLLGDSSKDPTSSYFNAFRELQDPGNTTIVLPPSTTIGDHSNMYTPVTAITSIVQKSPLESVLEQQAQFAKGYRKPSEIVDNICMVASVNWFINFHQMRINNENFSINEKYFGAQKFRYLEVPLYIQFLMCYSTCLGLSEAAVTSVELTSNPQSLRFEYPLETDTALPSPTKSRGKKSAPAFYRDQDRFVPINNISRTMRNAIPKNGKVSKDAKECMQECVSEFISFLTSEASDRCIDEKRKTITGDDILFALSTLGFDNYVDPLQNYLKRYRNYTQVDKEMKGYSSLVTDNLPIDQLLQDDSMQTDSNTLC
jgi:nuclear transcription Y subunit beta